ncbi:MAG TPA: TonB-dependent receptor [Ohtaekwangia sp.]|nr:TonB-dependent receptor [Ohtaekwangia sp.]
MVNNYKTQETWQLSVREKGEPCLGDGRSAGWLSAFKKSLLMLLALFLVTGAFAQDQQITGTVRDENGQTLPGVSILLKGSSGIGTTTGSNGDYTLAVPANQKDAVLVFSFIGYKTAEVVVGSQSQINVQFELDLTTLGEVVVVGYGTQERKDVTGSISTISQDQLNQGAITNPLQQIAGRAPGVSITQISSEPGAAPSVRIRGITSLRGGNDPLVVVDGIQGNMDLLNQIPPSEIESVDILKDASATAIYGSRGAPGVILVTTKKGKDGKTTVEYNVTASVDYIPENRKLKVLDAAQWSEQALLNGAPASVNHGSNTDWFDLLTRTGYTQNHTFSFGGGSKSFSYRAALTAILQDGVVLNSDNKRYIGSLQATQRALDDRLTLTFNLNSSINNSTGSPSNVGPVSFQSTLVSLANIARPTDPVFDTDGKTYYRDAAVFQYINPYAVAKSVINEGTNNSLIGTLRADLEIIDGLTAGWFGSWRKTDQMWGYYNPAKSTIEDAITRSGIANISNNRTDEKLMNMSFSYTKRIDDHALSALILYEWQNQTYFGNWAQATGFVNDLTTYNRLQAGDLTLASAGNITSYKNDRTLVSFLGRVNYSFRDKYLLTISLRRDGSTVFGANYKWGNFPAASVAWRVDEEAFMENQEIFQSLKIRGGYGITGNQQGLYPAQSRQLVESSANTYFGGREITNFTVVQPGNADLRWETRKQSNVGIDFSLLDGRLNGSVDAFRAITENLLFNYTVPKPPYPTNNLIANVGSMENKGIEIALGYDLIKNQNTTLTLGGNVSFLRNEVLKLGGSINGVPVDTDYVPWGATSTYLIEGHPIGTFNMLRHTGVDETGEETVQDRDENGAIDQGVSSNDRYIAGSALPTYTYAITPSFKHKNFDVSMLWRGSGGNKIYNNMRHSLSMLEIIGRANVLESALPLGMRTSQYASDVWLEDGSFFRLENVTVGYTLPVQNIKYLERVRVSLTGNNLLLFTNYSGVDPEINVSGSNPDNGYNLNMFGGDRGAYPRTRSIAVGLNIVFK